MCLFDGRKEEAAYLPATIDCTYSVFSWSSLFNMGRINSSSKKRASKKTADINSRRKQNGETIIVIEEGKYEMHILWKEEIAPRFLKKELEKSET